MERNNETWLAHLCGDSQEQHAALSDLREYLLHGLRAAMWKWNIADDTVLEDAVQDSLIRILNRLQQFEGRSRFLTWAMAIAVHVAVGELRRKRWTNVSLDDVIADAGMNHEITEDNHSRPDIQLERESYREMMIKNLHDMIRNDLTEKQRVALLAELKGLPLDQIARNIGSNRNAVYKLTHDARKRLKRSLELAGYRCDDLRTAFEN